MLSYFAIGQSTTFNIQIKTATNDLTMAAAVDARLTNP